MDLFWKNYNKSLSLDAKIGIAAWKIEGIKAVNKFWLNKDVGQSFETVWANGGTYEWIPTASVLDIVSTSLNDAITGTGARTLRIFGLDVDYNEIEEDIQLNGTTIVQTTKQFLRIHRMLVTSAWSLATGEGNITAQIGATVYANIQAGDNQTLLGLYTIPAGYTGLVVKGKASGGKDKDIEIRFRGRPLGGVFGLYHSFFLFQNNYEYEFGVPLAIPEKTDVLAEAKADIAGTKVAVAFDIILVRN